MHQEFFDVLHRDHEEVASILSQAEKATGSARHDHIVHLREEIIPHMRAEEAVFYPPLVQNRESNENAEEGLEEHEEARETLDTLLDMSTSSGDWITTFRELKMQIEHHVDEEEGKIFADARMVISEERMKSILTKFKEEKERVKTAVETM